MKRLIVSGLIAVTSLAAAATMWQPSTWSIIGTGGAAPTPLAQESQSWSAASRLPVQDFDDRSLVFPRETKQP